MHAQDPVNRIMTETVLSVDAGAPAGEALRLFAACPIHHLPVVDGGVVVGVLGSTDLMRLDMLMPKGADSAIAYLNQRLCVRELVKRAPVVVGERQSIEEAAELMARHAIHALPVVNARQHLVGIVTTTDIMNAALGGPKHEREAKPAAAAPTGSTEPSTAADLPVPRLEPAELAAAVGAAQRSHVSGTDAQGIAAGLLYLHHRVGLLETVRHAAERFLNAGHDEQLHAVLLKAVQAARAGAHTGGDAPRPLGLGG